MVDNWKPKKSIFGDRLRLVGADTFLYMVEMCKSVWFSGRFGGGKTSGCYIIASWLYAHRKVDRIMSNIPDVVSVPVSAPVNKTALIIDESWQFLSGWDDVKAYAAYLRKLELILLMPSVFPPNPRLRMLSTYRIYDGYTTGIPLWVYRWDMVMNGVREKGLYFIFNPAAVFGMFDTKYIPDSDKGIVDAIEQTIILSGGEIKHGSSKGKSKKSSVERILEESAIASSDSSHAFSTAAAELAQKIRRH